MRRSVVLVAVAPSDAARMMEKLSGTDRMCVGGLLMWKGVDSHTHRHAHTAHTHTHMLHICIDVYVIIKSSVLRSRVCGGDGGCVWISRVITGGACMLGNLPVHTEIWNIGTTRKSTHRQQQLGKKNHTHICRT